MSVPVGMELSPSPQGLEEEYGTLFTSASLLFLHQLVSEFDNEVDQETSPGVCVVMAGITCCTLMAQCATGVQPHPESNQSDSRLLLSGLMKVWLRLHSRKWVNGISALTRWMDCYYCFDRSRLVVGLPVLRLRVSRKAHLDTSGDLPGFSQATSHIRGDPSWKVLPVPPRLQRRHVDVGDMAPCDTQRLIQALQSPAQGLQIDFDDGNCPTFYNQIKGINNVCKVVHNQFPNVPAISQAPVLMLRPRAWNMVEHNMLVNGKEVPGPLFDFGLLMFHCGKALYDSKSGPFFYLSKVESFMEARLWNNIFLWAQDQLCLPRGSIKATVLIENVLATFEMDEILYALRQHSAGLNCGIWDYSASFVNKFGHREAFLLPDRSKYVNMEKRFLRSYMDLLVQTCHRRGALATGGMAAALLPPRRDSHAHQAVLANVTRLKLLEIKAGVDGFMVYDLKLIEPMQKLFQQHTGGDNQLHRVRDDVTVTPEDLVCMPAGGVTLHGLKYNIGVGILFIHAWLSGKGHFFYRGQVEDSATAEISRSQVWQWIRHQAQLEDSKRVVTRTMVVHLTQEVMKELTEVTACQTGRAEERLQIAAEMFLEVVLKRDFPEFLTTYLNLDHTFLSSQAQRENVASGALMSKL